MVSALSDFLWERYSVDYLETESTSSHTPLAKYLLREATLIFKAYGNHPSFTMFTLGNELGRTPAMYQMVAYFKEIDPRHLCARGANNMHWAPGFAEGDDLWVTGKTGKTLPVRGSFFPADYRPLIHVIDNFARNHKLGLLFETKMGQGKLLVCASDLPALLDHPEARQLMHSLLRYVDSRAFDPTTELDGELLKRLLPGGIQ